MASKKSRAPIAIDVTPTRITPETTFHDLFETKMLIVPFPVFVGLLPSSQDNKEYLQPNVNHHFFNDGSSFKSLDSAFKKWVKEGTGEVSTEFNAILMSEKNDKPNNDDFVAFNMFGVSNKSLKENMFGEVEWDCKRLQKDFFENINKYDYDEYGGVNFKGLKENIKHIFNTEYCIEVSILYQHLSNRCSFLTEIKGSLLSWLHRWIA